MKLNISKLLTIIISLGVLFLILGITPVLATDYCGTISDGNPDGQTVINLGAETFNVPVGCAGLILNEPTSVYAHDIYINGNILGQAQVYSAQGAGGDGGPGTDASNCPGNGGGGGSGGGGGYGGDGGAGINGDGDGGSAGAAGVHFDASEVEILEVLNGSAGGSGNRGGRHCYFGMGGGEVYSNYGGAGGQGAKGGTGILLNATGSITVDGNINVSGGNGSPGLKETGDYWYGGGGGGGGGGTIILKAPGSLTINGTLLVNGGQGGSGGAIGGGGGGGRIKLFYNNLNDTPSSYVYHGGTGGGWSGGNGSLTRTQLDTTPPTGPLTIEPGTIYYVRLWNGINGSSSSFTIPRCITAPTAPTASSLSANCTSTNPNIASFSWDTSPGAISYTLSYTLASTPPTITNETVTCNPCTDIVKTVTPGNYSWQVKACNAATCSPEVNGPAFTCNPPAYLKTSGGDVHSNK